MNSQRRRGRHAKLAIRSGRSSRVQNADWAKWKNPYRPIEVFSADQIEMIHTATMKLLSEKGIRVLNDEAIHIYRKAGAIVDHERMVRFDPDHILALIGTAPNEIQLKSRNPERSVKVGGCSVAVATTGGSPYFSDMQEGRRRSTLATFDTICKLAESFDVIHIMGPNVEPQDVDLRFRHLQMARSQVSLTDKVPFFFFRGTQAIADSYEIARIAHGLTKEELLDTAICYSVANSNSPLQLDKLMCRGIIDAARAGQMMILTPFTLAGAMAPITITGALTLQNAEALAGIALSQIVRPGAPVCYGSFTSNVDMKSGSPAFGTPEYTKAAFASGQLARRYRLPFRSSSTTTSNAPDVQAVYESQMSLWGAIMGGCNILLHGAGWLESGLTASAEKFIIDIEMLQMFAELLKPLACDEESIGIDVIKDVGPGGHFFGTAHTLERFQTGFYTPLLSDWQNYDSWVEGGAIDAMSRANEIYNETINAFVAPAFDAARIEEIDEYIAKRQEEGGADIDY